MSYACAFGEGDIDIMIGSRPPWVVAALNSIIAFPADCYWAVKVEAWVPMWLKRACRATAAGYVPCVESVCVHS